MAVVLTSPLQAGETIVHLSGTNLPQPLGME